MSESETYKELGALTRCKERWERWGWHILMQSKATCLLLPPSSIMKSLFRFAHDEAPGVRLAFIWASENITTNAGPISLRPTLTNCVISLKLTPIAWSEFKEESKGFSFFCIFAKKKIMHILQQPISREELRSLAGNTFGDMIKCVADVSMGILALDAELHADLERLLLENGSAQENLWGFNLYPNEEGEDFIEYDSLINIRSWQGNPSRGISNPETREAIEKIVAHFIIR